MLPGPTIIRKCSACGQLIEESTILSGNTFGATYWTDGKRDAPMLPDSLWLVQCPHCQALVWLDEQEQAGEKEPWGADDTFEGSRPVAEPTHEAYLHALAEGLPSAEKERYVRLRAWWSGNDTRRGAKTRSGLSEKELRNLEAFAELLDEGEGNDRLTKAEIMRELGRFDEAAGLLTEPFSEELSRAAAFIGKLVREENTQVAEMQFDRTP